MRQRVVHRLDRRSEPRIFDIDRVVHDAQLTPPNSTKALMKQMTGHPVRQLLTTGKPNQSDRQVERSGRAGAGHVPSVSHIHRVRNEHFREPIPKRIENVVIASRFLTVENPRRGENKRPGINTTKSHPRGCTLPQPLKHFRGAMTLRKPTGTDDRQICVVGGIETTVRTDPNTVTRDHCLVSGRHDDPVKPPII